MSAPSVIGAARHADRARTPAPSRFGLRQPASAVVWTLFVVGAVLLLDFVDLTWYGLVVPLAALGVAVLARPTAAAVALVRTPARVDRADLVAVVGLYIAVVASFRLAFTGFTTDRTPGLFLSFAFGLLAGVGGPIAYTIWLRRRPLRTLGLTLARLKPTLALGLPLAAVQFALTLYGYDLPRPADWVPLLVMSLVVGLFEAVFFRGFIQGRLEASFGVAPAVLGAAALYAVYHLGYGMGGEEMVFLFGLGVVYAIAYRLVENVLVLWPLLIPLGSFFNNLESGDIELPWASIAGFADVLVAMGVLIWLGHRTERRRATGRGARDERSQE